MLSKSDVITICAGISALASAISEPLLDKLTYGNGPYAAAVLTAAGIVAGVIIRVLTNPTNGPVVATAVLDTAPIVNANGGIVGTNLTSENLNSTAVKGPTPQATASVKGGP